MNQEDKELLLADLCARLPYEVQCEIGGRRYGPYTFVGDDVKDLMEGRMFKPYLRSMDDMTEEEKKEMHNLLSPEGTTIYENDGIALPFNHCGEFVPYEYMSRVLDWLNAQHFNYRLPEHLYIKVTKENNPYKM